MANVYSIAFSVLGIVGMHSCMLVWTALLLPGPVERASKRLERQPIATFLIGLVCCLLTVGLVSGFFLVRTQSVPQIDESLQFLSDNLQVTRFYNDAWIITNALVWLLAAPIMVGLIVGGAGFSQVFAGRARSMMREDRPLVGLAIGALCTSASYFLPLVGWFVFVPVVGLMSIGAGICGILDWRGARAAA